MQKVTANLKKKHNAEKYRSAGKYFVYLKLYKYYTIWSMANSVTELYFHCKLCLRLKNVSVFQGPFDVGNMILSFEGVTQIMMALAQSDRSMHQVSCLILIVLSWSQSREIILYLDCVVQFFSSPEHEVLSELLWSFNVRRPSSVHASVRPCVNNFFKQHHLFNLLWEFDQTSQEWSLGGPLSKLFKPFQLVA